MAHGGYGKRRQQQAGGRRPKSLATVDKKTKRPKSLAVDKKTKPKSVSVKNQIRSIERMLRKELPPDVKEAQEKKLDGFKKQQENLNRLALERKIFLRNRKIKFFERRKVERRIRRLEKQQRGLSGQPQEAELAEQLSKLKEDLEYVRFFPKTETYVSLFLGGEDEEIADKRDRLRKVIKDNLIAAAACGKDLEETGSEDDGLLDLSEDDFFLSGSSSDDADADDEWTDKSNREQASSASGIAASGMSSDEKNQISARALMPPPRPSKKSFSGSSNDRRFGGSSSRKSKPTLRKTEMSTSSNTSNSIGYRKRGLSDPQTGNSDNISSISDARKPRRKRRPKKKQQQG